MSLLAKNESKRIQNEWYELSKKNIDLWRLINNLSFQVEKKFNKDVIITHIYRRQQEQEHFYGKGTKRKSSHQYWHSLDLRSSIYTKDEIEWMVDYLNNNSPNNYYKVTAFVHDIGHGVHFHIQYLKTFNKEE